ncbi:uracil-DNA glycosylase [Burkholderia vietnamiensis]|uniref:uracil-DNA glycosylase n=1 Tax=Burkholderia vietnamiensis TaxID=60552 RepID=UPI000621D7AE|nr:uracil-DNA glycosylase [Burkholderia vietnamiensis]KKI37485.1 uracil-DNA glycosylase [Burkholderia vietnamiensis]KVE69407.1 uracil-DNA glycosylase [Burkholderia vietnamiensis]
MDLINTPRSFKHPEAIARRCIMLNEPHIAPLTAYVESLRTKHPTWEFQDFDPADGGTEADMLFLFEKPGPMTSSTGKRRGSGFISRNNDDPTAEATSSFMADANIDRRRTVIWNVVPGWNGTIKVSSAECRDGLEELKNLIALLPHLKTVVLVGRKAGKAEEFMRSLELNVFTSAHPSPKVRSTNRAMWDLIPKRWAAAGKSQSEAIC